ncbi:MAG TPA: hypothetical protein VJN89_14730 [Candidatus Acidoferrum sp.]|nr:hypothetical protein [Candidatus Acidoferrum sp.]
MLILIAVLLAAVAGILIRLIIEIRSTRQAVFDATGILRSSLDAVVGAVIQTSNGIEELIVMQIDSQNKKATKSD